MKSVKVNKIPVNKDGSIEWSPNHIHPEWYEWVDNHRFNAILYLVGLIKRGKTCKFLFETLDRTKKYEVFCDDLTYMMEHMDHGVVSGSFEFVHRGGYYGIALIHPAI